MNDGDRPSFLDGLVDGLAGLLDAVGLNGTRLRWKWRQKRHQLSESGLRTEIAWRAAKAKHKMCPECRALVDRSAASCPDCGAGMSRVSTPGITRMLTNLLPGATAATSLLMLTNGFWFVMLLMAQVKTGGGGGGLFGGFDGRLLYQFGSGFSPMTLSGEWWRIVTPIFLHGGLLHFFFNSYVLLQLGSIAEAEFGTPRFWVIYLTCGIAGSVASQFLRPVNTVGASGAIMGLMGLLLVYSWRHGGVGGRPIKDLIIRYLVYIAIMSLIVRGIDHINHVGGFACGALLALLLGREAGGATRPESPIWSVLAGAGVLLVLLSFYMVATRTIQLG